jgi:hypothetical protein
MSTVQKRESGRRQVYFAMAAALVTVSGLLLILLSSPRWFGHGLVSLMGLVSGGLVVVAGATMAGRLSRPGPDTYREHRFQGILFGLLMLAAFGLGLVATAKTGKPLFGSLHGWLGLAVAVLATFQEVSSLLVRNRKRLRPIHRLVGYSSALLLPLQAGLGLAAGVTGATRVLVTGHSTLGIAVLVALIWVIVETSQQEQFHLERASFAAWAAVIGILLAWLIGGYHYLTVYGPQLKSVVLNGEWPWAHRIMMEAKEHLFLFLPVVSGALALLLSTGDNGRPESREDVRRAALLTAWFALCTLTVLLVFGAFISMAAHPAARLYQ